MQHHRVAAAVHDRDSDIPVVFYGLCLSRSHHLFGLIERDRSVIVTDTFVNRHHSLPFVGAAQHAINVSEPLGRSDFAERNVMECLVGAADHSGLMLAARITLRHFSVSLTMKVSKSAEEPANIALPRSERRACTWGSARIALISLLSLSMIAPGVLLRRPMAHHWLAS